MCPQQHDILYEGTTISTATTSISPRRSPHTVTVTQQLPTRLQMQWALPRKVLQNSICLLLSNSFQRNVQHLFVCYLVALALHFQATYNMLLFVWNNVLFVC